MNNEERKMNVARLIFHTCSTLKELDQLRDLMMLVLTCNDQQEIMRLAEDFQELYNRKYDLESVRDIDRLIAESDLKVGYVNLDKGR